jgi:hypothetical protein
MRDASVPAIPARIRRDPAVILIVVFRFVFMCGM